MGDRLAMPFRFLPGNVIECDTVEEALSLQRASRGSVAAPISNGSTVLDRRDRVAQAIRQQGHGSIRDRVLAIAKDWVAVDGVVQLTGLEPRQVRGVLLAPGLKDRIERRTSALGREYRLRHTKEDT
jgi:hypothetical protein